MLFHFSWNSRNSCDCSLVTLLWCEIKPVQMYYEWFIFPFLYCVPVFICYVTNKLQFIFSYICVHFLHVQMIKHWYQISTGHQQQRCRYWIGIGESWLGPFLNKTSTLLILGISSLNNLRKPALTQQWKEQHRSHVTLTPDDLLCSVSLSWRFSTTSLVLKVSHFKRGVYVPGEGTKGAKNPSPSCCRCPDD